MDRTLFKAACSGDINTLHRLLEQNPFLLSDATLIHPKENPLTIAIKANQTTFALELLKLHPQLSIESDQDGIHPLDVASCYGNMGVVKGILELGFEAYLLKGKDERTAIHYAAMNGRVEIIDELLAISPDSLKDVTIYGENAFHFAVKCYKFDALRSFLQWSEKIGMMGMVNSQDKEGNTILHYAASRKQRESIEILAEWKKTGHDLEMDVVNKKGLTPMDIIDMLSDSSTDITLRNIMLRYGASATPHQLEDIIVVEPNNNDPVNNEPVNSDSTNNDDSAQKKKKNFGEVCKYFRFQWDRDSPDQARNTLLLVAALIATVTYQAATNPPTNLPKDGAMIIVFFVANTISLICMLAIIDYLTGELPFQRELRASMYCLYFAYGMLVGANTAGEKFKWYHIFLYLALFVPFIMRFCVLFCVSFRKL